MAVTKIIPHPKREATKQAIRNNLLYEVQGRRYTLMYTVFLDASAHGPVDIFNAVGLPKIGDTYGPPFVSIDEADFLATCVEIQPNPTENRKIWHVIYTFDTERLISMDTDNPLAQPPDISWEVEQDERASLQDAYGATYQSSSLNPLDPPVSLRYAKSVLRITRNEAAFNETSARTYWNKISAYPFAGYAQGFARINYITGRSALVNGVAHYQVAYEIAFNPYGWFDFLLDADWRDVDKNMFLDNRGQPLSNPTPMNGRGRSLDVFETTEIAGNAVGFNAGSLSFDLILGRNAVRFPLPMNAPVPIPGVAGAATHIQGPHNTFFIRVTKVDPDTAFRSEISNRNDVLFPKKKPNNLQDTEVPVRRATPKFEIMRVTNIVVVPSGNPIPFEWKSTFTVERAQMGTTAIDWQATETIFRIYMLPYYRRFESHQYIDFVGLGLPIV